MSEHNIDPSTSTDNAGTGVILASASPRRRMLLPLVRPIAGVASPDIDETPNPGERAEELAERLAREKALQVSRNPRSSAECQLLDVIAADTVVSVDGAPLGKPTTPEEARAMLRALSNRWHDVITGVAIARTGTGSVQSCRVSTNVHIRKLDDAEIDAYVMRGEPFDKAGGYAIQDRELRPVDGISGCFPNVVGLPLCGVRALLDNATLSGDLSAVCSRCELCSLAAEVLKREGFWTPDELYIGPART